MSLKGESNGREKLAYGFQTPGMLKIIADVHRDVDAHRKRNRQKPWDWTGLNKILSAARDRITVPSWLAKKTISNSKKSCKAKPKMEPHTKSHVG